MSIVSIHEKRERARRDTQPIPAEMGQLTAMAQSLRMEIRRARVLSILAMGLAMGLALALWGHQQSEAELLRLETQDRVLRLIELGRR